MPGGNDDTVHGHCVCVPYAIEMARQRSANVLHCTAPAALTKISNLAAVVVVLNVAEVEQKIDNKRWNPALL
jgi:hypothetical protein